MEDLAIAILGVAAWVALVLVLEALLGSPPERPEPPGGWL